MMKMVEIAMPTNLHIKPTLTFNPSASISTWNLRKKPRETTKRKLGAVFASISSSSSSSSSSSHDTIGEELWPRSELCGSNKEKRASKKRVFFLDVNPLCYAGSTPSLHSFAHWISLFFSQVSLTDPVIAVLDGDGGSEHRRQLLPSYKAHRRKFSRKSSAPKKYPAERSHVVMDVLTKCNVPVVKIEGHEADDVVATLAGQVLQNGHKVVIASPDKDFKQLISEDVQIVLPIAELNRWSFYTLKHYISQYNCDPCSDLSLIVNPSLLMIMQQQTPLLLAFLLFVLAVLRLRKKSKGHDSSCKPPPGPRGLPIIGNIHQLAASVTVPHRLCAHWAKKYGPIMQLKIGEVNTVIISSPEVAKDVFNDINFAERPDLLVSQIMLYNGQGLTFAQYGDHWRQMRKICVLELFSAKRVRSFKSVREEEVSNLIRSIRSKAGSPIDIRKMLLDLSNVITSRSSIGTKYKNQAALLHVVEQVTRAVAGINVVDIFPSSRLLRMISQFRSGLQRLQEEADQMLQDIINERRAQRVEKKTGEIEEEDNILDVLLNLQDDRSFEISTDTIKSIILEIYTGGSETSTTVLEWIMSELMKNPSVMEKAQKEVRQVFNKFENVDETIVDNLNFMKLVIKESLRLHPPGTFIPRACSKTCQVNGYTIEAKTKVMVNAWAIGRDPKYWTEPEKFYPERFLHSSVDYKGANFELVPFGAGRRMCPGMLFGMATVEFTLAQLLYHFDWKLADGATPEALDMQEIFASTMRRKHDLIVVPIPRRP